MEHLERQPTEQERAEGLLNLLASIDEWLGNGNGLMNEDIILWRDMLAKALDKPLYEQKYQSMFERAGG
jgi:hypothetical protein